MLEEEEGNNHMSTIWFRYSDLIFNDNRHRSIKKGGPIKQVDLSNLFLFYWKKFVAIHHQNVI